MVDMFEVYTKLDLALSEIRRLRIFVIVGKQSIWIGSN